MSKIKTTKINCAIPGSSMSQQNFEKMITEAENGQFHTIKAVKAEVEKWKIKYSR